MDLRYVAEFADSVDDWRINAPPRHGSPTAHNGRYSQSREHFQDTNCGRNHRPEQLRSWPAAYSPGGADTHPRDPRDAGRYAAATTYPFRIAGQHARRRARWSDRNSAYR